MARMMWKKKIQPVYKQTRKRVVRKIISNLKKKKLNMQPVEFRAVMFLLRGLRLTVTGFCGGLFPRAGEH